MPKKTERRDLLGFFTIHSVAKHQKIEGMKIFYFRKKISQCRKKLKGGDPLEFSNIHFVAKQQKIEGGTLWRQKKFEKKVAQCRKKLKGGTLLSRQVLYLTIKME